MIWIVDWLDLRWSWSIRAESFNENTKVQGASRNSVSGHWHNDLDWWPRLQSKVWKRIITVFLWHRAGVAWVGFDLMDQSNHPKAQKTLRKLVRPKGQRCRFGCGRCIFWVETAFWIRCTPRSAYIVFGNSSFVSTLNFAIFCFRVFCNGIDVILFC